LSEKCSKIETIVLILTNFENKLQCSAIIQGKTKMKVNTETLTRYLHRIRNHPGWIALNDVAENLKIDRATSRRFTNMAMEWGLVERQQLEDQPTEVRATKKLMALEPSGVRKVVDANSSSETPLL
jgi:hypothetical protein